MIISRVPFFGAIYPVNQTSPKFNYPEFEIHGRTPLMMPCQHNSCRDCFLTEVKKHLVLRNFLCYVCYLIWRRASSKSGACQPGRLYIKSQKYKSYLLSSKGNIFSSYWLLIKSGCNLAVC